MIIISLASYPCGAHQAAPEEILRKSLQPRKLGGNKRLLFPGLGGAILKKHLFTMDTLSTSSSKRNIWKDEMESYTEKKKKSKEILEILRFYLDTFITSPISVIQLFSTHWLTTTAKIPIPYQVNFASLYTVLRFYFLSHLHLRIERNG